MLFVGPDGLLFNRTPEAASKPQPSSHMGFLLAHRNNALPPSPFDSIFLVSLPPLMSLLDIGYFFYTNIYVCVCALCKIDLEPDIRVSHVA